MSAVQTKPKPVTTAKKQPKGANKRLGKLGEDMACKYLAENDFEIIERNWVCKSGEADIIAKKDGILIFIEVKTRSSQNYGLPEDAVNLQKRTKYENIAIYYLATHDLPSSRVRFDVISLMLIEEQKAFLRHHRDAYCTD